MHAPFFISEANDMSPTRPDASELRRLESSALEAQQNGRLDEALRHWNAILRQDAGNPRALLAAGQVALRAGDAEQARQHLQRATDLSRGDPSPWNALAMACRQLHDDGGEEAALFQALKADASDLMALLLRGQLFERQGKNQPAAKAYGAAAAVSPPMERLRPDLRPMVSHAVQFAEQHRQQFAAFMDEQLDAAFADLKGEDLSRFQLSLDIMVGRKRRFESQPMQYFVPQLQPIEFFDRSLFPWLDAFEEGTEMIRNELLAVLRDEQGLVPYLTYGADQPLNQWAELNQNPRWSAYHLIKDGLPVPDHAARCPGTMALLKAAPQPDQPGRTPVALFSLLKPRTRIPPHVGASNARLLTHLPLVIPPSCGFRVGNQTRQWEPGKAWVFDDSIEHEAWNNSDQLRVIMIFDVWHPHLTPPERAMITALAAALNRFMGAGGFDA